MSARFLDYKIKLPAGSAFDHLRALADVGFAIIPEPVVRDPTLNPNALVRAMKNVPAIRNKCHIAMARYCARSTLDTAGQRPAVGHRALAFFPGICCAPMLPQRVQTVCGPNAARHVNRPALDVPRCPRDPETTACKAPQYVLTARARHEIAPIFLVPNADATDPSHGGPALLLAVEITKSGAIDGIDRAP